MNDNKLAIDTLDGAIATHRNNMQHVTDMLAQHASLAAAAKLRLVDINKAIADLTEARAQLVRKVALQPAGATSEVTEQQKQQVTKKKRNNE